MADEANSLIGVIIGLVLLCLLAIGIIFPSVGVAILSAIWQAIVWVFTLGH